MSNQKSIYVWRSKGVESIGHYRTNTNCKWCNTQLLWDFYFFGEKLEYTDVYCPLCGWYGIESIKNWSDYGHHGPSNPIQPMGADQLNLMDFDINSDEVLLEEIGTYLRKNFSDIYSLDWRKFEELVADIYKQKGYEVVLTAKTKDNGADALIINNGKITSIIECKKYAENRKIGIEYVRSLVGACVDWNVKKAYLVSTSDHTVYAENKRQSYIEKGYEIELVSGTNLLSELEIYNSSLPQIGILDTSTQKDLILHNTKIHKDLKGDKKYDIASGLVKPVRLVSREDF